MNFLNAVYCYYSIIFHYSRDDKLLMQTWIGNDLQKVREKQRFPKGTMSLLFTIFKKPLF